MPALEGPTPFVGGHLPSPSTLTRPSEASTPPSEAEQLLLSSICQRVLPRALPSFPTRRSSDLLKLSPTVPEAGSWVVAIAGWAWAISTGSSAQPLVASLLFASPE